MLSRKSFGFPGEYDVLMKYFRLRFELTSSCPDGNVKALIDHHWLSVVFDTHIMVSFLCMIMCDYIKEEIPCNERKEHQSC